MLLKNVWSLISVCLFWGALWGGWVLWFILVFCFFFNRMSRILPNCGKISFCATDTCSKKSSWFNFWWNHIYFIILNYVYVYLLCVWLLWSRVAKWLERAVSFPQWLFVAAKNDNTTVRCSQWLLWVLSSRIRPGAQGLAEVPFLQDPPRLCKRT